MQPYYNKKYLEKIDIYPAIMVYFISWAKLGSTIVPGHIKLDLYLEPIPKI
jgi:hypothetical protein